MNEKRRNSVQMLTDAVALRKRAEQRALDIEQTAVFEQLPQESQLLQHELQVYQIELEMQNEELRAAQARIEISREKYYDLYDLAPISYFTISKKGLIYEVNFAGASMLGLSNSALVKRPFSRFILKEDQAIYYLFRKNLFDNGTPQTCELRIVKADNTTIWCSLHAALQQDNDGVVSMQVVILDIDIQKKAQADLLQSEKHFRNAFIYSAIGIALVSPEGRWIRVNRSVCEILGYSENELMSKTFQDITYPEDLDSDLSFVQRMLAGEIDTYQMEKRYYHKQGHVIWVLLAVSLVRDEYGAPLHFISQLEDITERKTVESFRNFLSETSGRDENFFNALANYLAQSLAMDFVCIDRLEGDGLNAQTLAVWSDGHFQDNIRYALKDTPCGDVVGKEVCCFPASVIQFFPRDQVLQDLRAESYLGVTLFSHSGQPIGLIAVIGRTPLRNRSQSEAVLKLAAMRAANELERIEIESELSDSNARYRSSFLQSTAVKLIIDPETGNIIDANQAAIDYYGFTNEEIIQMNISQINIAKPVEIQEKIAAAVTMSQTFFNFNHRLVSGEVRDVEVYSSPILVNGKTMLHSIIHDVTRQNRFQNLMAEIAAEIVTVSSTDFSEKINYMLETSGNFFGVERAYLFFFAEDHNTIDRAYRWYASMMEPENDFIKSISFYSLPWFSEQVENNGFIYLSDKEKLPIGIATAMNELTGQNILSLLAVPVFENEKPIGFLGFDCFREKRLWTNPQIVQLKVLGNILSDVHKKVKLENQLRNSVVMAESANIAKSEFLANMSHEIRTPLNAIVGFIKILLRTDLSLQQKAYLSRMEESSQILISLIGDVLDMSKVESHNLKLETVPFNLRDLLNQVLNQNSLAGIIKGLDVQVNIDKDVPVYLVGDPLRIKQILSNLLNNAIKFTDKGEIIIAAQLIKINRSNALIQLSVKDTGIGMSKETIQKICRPFSQAETSTTRIYGGTGLGLAITKSLVELMEGAVVIESRPDEGTIVFVTIQFPIAIKDEIAVMTAKPETNEGSPEYKGIRVLLVEDNPINQEVARVILIDAGMTVTIANNGKQAIEIVEDNTYDIVLMDIHMPVMDGFDATRAIRRNPAFSKLPIIGLTADVFSTTRQKCYEAGFDDFVSKPLDTEELFAKIRELTSSGLNREKAATGKENNLKRITLPDFEGIDIESPLRRLGGNLILYKELLKEFHNSHRYDAEEILSSIEKDDYKTAEFLVHSIKGVAGNLGAQNLYSVAKNLELALKTKKKDNLASLMDDFKQTLLKVFNTIETIQFSDQKIDDSLQADKNANPFPIQRKNKSILLVDDSPDSIAMLSSTLLEYYEIQIAMSGDQALKLLDSNKKLPDLILLDVKMPGIDGFEVSRLLKTSERLKDIPIIFLSALSDIDDKARGFENGGVDYIQKPFEVVELLARVNTHLQLHDLLTSLEKYNKHLNQLVEDKIKDISDSQMSTIYALAKLAESRDDDAGEHLTNVQRFCRLMAEKLTIRGEITADFIAIIEKASALHDIGKVGIRDAVLLKPGKLTPLEFEEIKQHSAIGAKTLREVHEEHPNNIFINIGIEISESHHEKWDGSGYPNGLKGDNIPLSARIVAIADVYDALRSKRVYKDAMSHEKACEIIVEGRGRSFDPHLVDVFIEHEEEFANR